MDLPRNDDDKSTDSEKESDDDLRLYVQALSLTTPEKNKGNRTLSDNIRGRPVLDRPSKKSAIPRIQELQVETLSSPPKNQPKRKSKRQLQFTDGILLTESSPGCGKQPRNPFKERNQSMMDFLVDVPKEQSTRTSSGDSPKQRWTSSSPEDDSKQQSTSSSSADSLRRRRTRSSLENDPKQRCTSSSSPDDSKQQSTSSSSPDTPKRRWTRSSPDDDSKRQSTSSSSADYLRRRWTRNSLENDPKQQSTSSSSADSLKRRWTRTSPKDDPTQRGTPSSPEDAAKPHLTLPCKTPAPSPTKGVPEQAQNSTMVITERVWDKNVFSSPPKTTTKRKIGTSECESESGSTSPDTKRHRRDVVQPMGQSSSRMDGQGSSEPPALKVRKRRYSSALEMVTEGEAKKSKDEKD